MAEYVPVEPPPMMQTSRVMIEEDAYAAGSKLSGEVVVKDGRVVRSKNWKRIVERAMV